MKLRDLKGKVFGKLTVISQAGNDRQSYAMWLCLCQCGNYKTVRGCNLVNGMVASCGCSRIKNLETIERRLRYHEGHDEEIIICRTFPADMKKRLEQLARMRGTSMQDTIKFALMSFVEMQERQAWFLNATVPVEVESEEGVEEVQP